ncbi:MFS toxin efflux pump [Aspergillus insuetus]
MKGLTRHAGSALLKYQSQHLDSTARLNSPAEAELNDYPCSERDSITLNDNIRSASSSSALPERKTGCAVSDTLNNDNDPPTNEGRLSPLKASAVIIGLSAAAFCISLDCTILSTAIPKIVAEFKSQSEMGWYVSAYSLTLCGFSLVYGKLYKFYSTKWIFMITLGLFEGGSLICGATPSSLGLIIGRVISGLGGSGMYLGCMLIVAEIMPLDKIPIFTSLLSGLYGVAAVIGPLMGGAFTDYVSWRWCFYINLPFGAVSALFVLLFVKSNKPQTPPTDNSMFGRLLELDLVGTILLLPAIICLLLALQWGGATYPWANWRIVLLLVLCGVLILGFAATQHWQQDRATIPPRLIKNRNVWGSVMFIFCISGAFMIMTYYLPIWFQSIKNATATSSGVMNLPMVLGVIISSLLSGTAVSWLGHYTPFIYVTPILASCGAALLTTLHVHSSSAAWIGYQALYGIGIGTGMTLPIVVMQTALAAADISTGTALISFTQTFSGALFNFVAQNVFQSQVLHNYSQSDADLGRYSAGLLESGPGVLRSLIPSDSLPAALEAYNGAIIRTFYVALGLSAVAILGAPPIQWLSVKEKRMQAAAA